MYYVYKIENTINGKKYIGFTDFDPTLLTMADIYILAVNQEELPHLVNGMKKYGHNSFEIEVQGVYEFEQNAIDVRDAWIDEYDTLSPYKGYQQNLKLIPLRDKLPSWLASNMELNESMRKVEEIAEREAPIENMVDPNLTPSKASDTPYDKISKAILLLKEMQQAYLNSDYSTVLSIYKDFSQYVEVDTDLDDIIHNLLISAKGNLINMLYEIEF